MIIGVTATALTFIALLISVTSYYLYYNRPDEAHLKVIARTGFYVATVLIFFQAGLLLWGILTHKFDWSYVLSYSSRDLTLYYLVSTFWAGQEGTFLLWLVFGQIYGLIIIRVLKEDEPLVMSFMMLVQAYVVLILIKQNPFAYIWEVNPAAFPVGFIPADGNGLNPLLQDPWMTIHPPILFAGYSSTMIIFAFAMSALIKRNYQNWIKPSYPFALFVNLTLGAGIILGGYWAYTTLGWGGFWGWDPVENSSLIPWLTSLALLHGMIIQRRQGGMRKTNIFLALLSFILVLYGSFLTRSGVLTDFSVHSFGSSEIEIYLIGFILLFIAISLLAFMFRIKEIESQKVQTELVTRESFILFGIILLLLFGFLVFIGTSSPLITSLFGNPSNVSVNYYNTLAGPIAILMALLIALAPILRWKTDSTDKLKTISIHAALSIVITAGAFFLGMTKVLSLIVFMIAIFSILINGQIALKMWKKKNYRFGGYLTHVGIGFMIIGILISSVYDRSQKITLPKGSEFSVMGYHLQYEGKQPSPDGKDKVKVLVNNKTLYAKFYWSDYSRAYMVSPAVKNTVIYDLYISPIQIISATDNQFSGDQVVLKKKQQQKYDDYVLEFTGYEMNQHQMQGGEIHLATVINVYDKGGQLLGTVKPGITMRGEKKDLQAAYLPDTEREINIKGINVDQGTISLVVAKKDAQKDPYAGRELLAVEVTIKPMINLLWLGTVLMIIGFIMSIIQRRKESFS